MLKGCLKGDGKGRGQQREGGGGGGGGSGSGAAAAADEEDCGGNMTKVSGDVQFNLFLFVGGCFRLSFTCVGLQTFQFGELVSQCSLAILAGETAIYVGTGCDSM